MQRLPSPMKGPQAAFGGQYTADSLRPWGGQANEATDTVMPHVSMIGVTLGGSFGATVVLLRRFQMVASELRVATDHQHLDRKPSMGSSMLGFRPWRRNG